MSVIDATPRDGTPVTIALEPDQLAVIADELIGDLSSRFDSGLEVRTPDDIARVRALLDEYEQWLDALKWGEATTRISVTLPRSLLEGVAYTLYETAGDRLFHSGRKKPISAVRDDMTLALVATAIVDQLEATR